MDSILIMARNFTIYNNKNVVVQIRKAMFNLKDSYEINIFEDTDELMCISFVIVIDNSIHN